MTKLSNAIPPDDDEPPPQGDFLLTMIQRIATLTECWRQCESRLCRRERRCADAALRCSAREPIAAMTPEQHAKRASDLKQMLRERMAELAREG